MRLNSLGSESESKKLVLLPAEACLTFLHWLLAHGVHQSSRCLLLELDRTLVLNCAVCVFDRLDRLRRIHNEVNVMFLRRKQMWDVSMSLMCYNVVGSAAGRL